MPAALAASRIEGESFGYKDKESFSGMQSVDLSVINELSYKKIKVEEQVDSKNFRFYKDLQPLFQNEEHTFEAIEDTILISIFNPPLNGNETHDENGNYGI